MVRREVCKKRAHEPLTLRQSHEEGMCTFQTKQLVQLGTQHLTSADRKPLALCQSHKDGMCTFQTKQIVQLVACHHCPGIIRLIVVII